MDWSGWIPIKVEYDISYFHSRLIEGFPALYKQLLIINPQKITITRYEMIIQNNRFFENKTKIPDVKITQNEIYLLFRHLHDHDIGCDFEVDYVDERNAGGMIENINNKIKEHLKLYGNSSQEESIQAEELIKMEVIPYLNERLESFRTNYPKFYPTQESSALLKVLEHFNAKASSSLTTPATKKARKEINKKNIYSFSWEATKTSLKKKLFDKLISKEYKFISPDTKFEDFDKVFSHTNLNDISEKKKIKWIDINPKNKNTEDTFILKTLYELIFLLQGKQLISKAGIDLDPRKNDFHLYDIVWRCFCKKGGDNIRRDNMRRTIADLKVHGEQTREILLAEIINSLS